MHQLPFLIVHGAWIWIPVLFALIVASFGILWLIRRAVIAIATRTAIASLSRTQTPLRTGPVCVRGRLVGGRATSAYYGNERVDERPPTLAIECDGQRIELLGRVRVDHGTSARAWWLRPPRSVSMGNALPNWNETIAKSVGEHDEVFVVGTADVRQTGTSFREPGAYWSITDSGETIAVSAVRARALPRALGPGRISLFAVLAFGLLFGALRHAGHLMLENAERESMRATLSELDDISIAAALPGSREDALQRLSRVLEYDMELTDENVALRIAFDEFRGICPSSTWMRLNRLDEALDSAQRCGTRRDIASVLAFEGRYQEAASYLEPGDHSYLALVVAIATRNWSDAAISAKALNPKSCLPGLFKAYAGDAHAFDGVDTASTHCQLLHALSLPIDRQPQALADIEPGDAADVRYLRRMFWFAATGDTDPDGIATVVRHGLSGFELWLAQFPAVGSADSPMRHRSLALLALMRGDVQTARRERQTIGDRLEDYQIDPLDTQIALEDFASGPPDRTQDILLEDMVDIRRGDIAADAQHRLAARDSSYRDALYIAERGDGGPLAATIRRQASHWYDTADDVFAVLPRVQLHRDELVRATRFMRDEFATGSYDRLPYRWLSDVSRYRDLARVAGDSAEEARWEAIFDRHASVLADRERVIAFLLLYTNIDV